MGCLYPLQGRGARFGHDSIIGAEMAADEINAGGGVLGREIRLLFTDDRSDPTHAVRAAIRYIQEDLVDFLFGVVSSSVALAINEVSRQYRKVFVGTDHASSRLAMENFQRYYFRVSPNTLQSMRAGARYCSGKPWATYLYIGPDYEYGHRQWEDFRDFLAALRPEVSFVGAVWPKLFEPDYRPYIREALRPRPDVVVHGFWGGDAVAFTRQALADGLHEKAQLVSFDAGGNYEVFEALGDLIPPGLVLSARHHNNWPETERNARFVRDFYARASRYPSYAAHGAYVGVHFIAKAAERAGTVGDPDALVEAAEGLSLATPGDRQGVTSRIRPIDHQIVRDYAIGVTGPDDGFPPASRMLGRWTVIEGERILPAEDEVLKRRRAARSAASQRGHAARRKGGRPMGRMRTFLKALGEAAGKMGLAAAIAGTIPLLQGPAAAAQARPAGLKIGVVSFLSGAAAAPFGVPSRNAAEVLIEQINTGKAPAPYDTKGIGGVPIRAVHIDEAGGGDKQVAELRRLVLDEKVDLVIGYISSADCLAVAPVAEELKKLTVLFDCGTNRIFEDRSYRHVFRTKGHQIIDNVGAARYILRVKPDLKAIAGINQNYAWGQDSWTTFRDSVLKLKPGVKVAAELFPKLFAGEYSAEISALQAARPDAVHTSFWGGDMEALVIQGTPRGLPAQSLIVWTTGDTMLPRLGRDIPKGMVIAARGPHGALAPKSALNDWFVKIYRDRYNVRPVYPSYHMSQAVLGVKAAYEKALTMTRGQWPTQDQVIAAFERLEFQTPSGPIKMALGKGHQGVEPVVYGITGDFDPAAGEVRLTNVMEFPVECVNPPEGMRSEDWIKQGFPRARCP